MHGDKCKAVYCHWDGHLESNGKVLLENYDSAKANHLVSLGSISSLGRSVAASNDSHSFDTPEKGVTVFYGRDRGDKDVDFEVFHSDQEMFEYYEESFYYVMKDGVWYFSNGFHGWMTLESALETAKETA
jgi:hypothetical protein